MDEQLMTLKTVLLPTTSRSGSKRRVGLEVYLLYNSSFLVRALTNFSVAAVRAPCRAPAAKGTNPVLSVFAFLFFGGLLPIHRLLLILCFSITGYHIVFPCLASLAVVTLTDHVLTASLLLVFGSGLIYFHFNRVRSARGFWANIIATLAIEVCEFVATVTLSFVPFSILRHTAFRSLCVFVCLFILFLLLRHPPHRELGLAGLHVFVPLLINACVLSLEVIISVSANWTLAYLTSVRLLLVFLMDVHWGGIAIGRVAQQKRSSLTLLFRGFDAYLLGIYVTVVSFASSAIHTWANQSAMWSFLYNALLIMMALPTPAMKHMPKLRPRVKPVSSSELPLPDHQKEEKRIRFLTEPFHTVIFRAMKSPNFWLCNRPIRYCKFFVVVTVLFCGAIRGRSQIAELLVTLFFLPSLRIRFPLGLLLALCTWSFSWLQLYFNDFLRFFIPPWGPVQGNTSFFSERENKLLIRARRRRILRWLVFLIIALYFFLTEPLLVEGMTLFCAQRWSGRIAFLLTIATIILRFPLTLYYRHADRSDHVCTALLYSTASHVFWEIGSFSVVWLILKKYDIFNPNTSAESLSPVRIQLFFLYFLMCYPIFTISLPDIWDSLVKAPLLVLHSLGKMIQFSVAVFRKLFDYSEALVKS